MRRVITTNKAPKAIGPYSQGIACSPGTLVFLSGQIPLDPITMQVVDGDIETQTQQVLQNIQALLTAANCDFSNVVKTTIFLKDMNEFARMSAVYESYFSKDPPARSTVEVVAVASS